MFLSIVMAAWLGAPAFGSAVDEEPTEEAEGSGVVEDPVVVDDADVDPEDADEDSDTDDQFEDLPPPPPPPPPTPAELCRVGEPDRCYEAGKAYFDGASGFPKDRFRAVQLYRLGCEAEFMRPCYALAEAYANGAGVAADADQAQDAYRKACEYGSGISCRMVGDQYVLVAANPRDATLWYGIGCELEDGPSCTATALAYERGGPHTPPDTARARSLFIAACRYGNGRGCTLLGYRYAKGLEGMKRDDDAALVLYQRGCQADDPEGCRYLAEFEARGRGGADPDPERAAETYAKACHVGDNVSCREVATKLMGTGDYRKAMLTAKRGCELGDAKSCKLAEKAQALRP